MDFDGDGPQLRERTRKGKLVTDGSLEKYKEAKQRHKSKQSLMRRQNIAVLDLETDPFDNGTKEPVFPFLAIVYSDQFSPIKIWDNDWRVLIEKLFKELAELPQPFTIYAHNGGRFDYMYFMHLIEGRAKFKGRALMSAKLGKHEIRDSLHIIPESLRNANRKLDIDYGRMHKTLREKHKEEITRYCLEDCIATFEIVRGFIDKFGMPMTIGQAAMAELKKHYSFKRLSEPLDRYFRQWFYGGRVECLTIPGHYKGEYKLYDVHSMYPSVMAHEKHPIGDEFLVNDKITARTAFIHLRCRNNKAFVSRQKNGTLTTTQNIGEFFTTIHEYKTAKELGLISHEKIIKTIDIFEWSNFRDFVIPLYEKRQFLKQQLKSDVGNRAIEQDIKFYKYLLNNCYGKFAQNPRNFKEYFLTPPSEAPDKEWLHSGVQIEASRMRHELEALGIDTEERRIEYVTRNRNFPIEEAGNYTIWAIPSLDWRFNNVATAASITGAARAKLLRAIHWADTPIYCDTDSLVCRDLRNTEITASELGTWNHEADISEFILAGKKLYGYHTPKYKSATHLDEHGKIIGEKIRAKGAQGVTWDELKSIVAGGVVAKTMFGPTISRTQSQHYLTRNLRMTG